ncbi:MAG: hypothetical protein IPN22_03415 [Bacteroidetes bacterium]|nr:hypothetical protein [Bacteroidota bacterium]
MLTSGKSFITDNLAALTPQMPPTFQVEYNTALTDFTTKYNTFTTLEATAPDSTITKIEANNAIYDDLMLLLGDLKAIVPAIYDDEVTFTYLKSIISSPGPAGLKGTITNSNSTLPVSEAILRLTDINRETTSEADGSYNFGNIRQASTSCKS